MVDQYFDEDTWVEIVKEIKLSKHNILGSLEDIPTFPHAWQPGIQYCGDGDSVVTVKEIVLSIVGVSAGCRDVVGMVTGDRMTISAS